MPSAELVSLTRSGRIESMHRGSVAIVNADGRLIASAGTADQPCYFRSACKPIQLLPLVEDGGIERLGLAERHVAVMAASHSGAPRHLEAVRDILAAAGLGPEALGCGYHEPRNRESRRHLLMGGEPAAIYNNCSGKHAGMLALAVLEGAGIETYMHPEHPAQRCITARVAAACGLSPDAAHTGTDGCSAPTLYAPLVAMARGFARLAREAAEPASAAARIGAAMARCPEMLGEEDDFQAVFSRELGQRAIGKYGAEGLYCVAVPERELGIAVRIEDGAQRAVAPVVLEILLELGIFDRQELGALSRFHEMTLTNWRGTEIGIMRSSVVLSREHDVETRDVERSARAARS